MLTAFVAIAAAVAVATAPTSALSDDNLPYSLGPWLAATANTPTIAVLEEALRGSATTADLPLSGSSAAGARVCFEEVRAIEQQIVNGINFRFHIKGCALRYDASEFGDAEPTARTSGRCPRTCGAQQELLRVTVFCQPWTQTAQVLGIVRDDEFDVAALA